MNKAVSDYMREMQRRSAESRWSGLSADEKRMKMSALAKARWAKRPKKPKRVAWRRTLRIRRLQVQLLPDAPTYRITPE